MSTNCLSCYKPAKRLLICSDCRRAVFDGVKINPTLDLSLELGPGSMAALHASTFCMPGSELKLSLSLVDDALSLTTAGEQGLFLLKVPLNDTPRLHGNMTGANEHLTTRIAKRIFKIPTVENSLVLLNGHDLAYMCRRFDIISDTERLHTENLSQLLDRRLPSAWEQISTPPSTYYDVAQLVMKNVSAPYPAAISFFRLAMFNYLFSNNNLNLSSFSIIEDHGADHCLAPYYNLSCTALHSSEKLREEFTLFQGDHENRFRTSAGYLRPAAFFEFGKRVGLPKTIIDDLFVQMLGAADTRVKFFISSSFLEANCRYIYKTLFEMKIEMWKKDLPGSIMQRL